MNVLVNLTINHFRLVNIRAINATAVIDNRCTDVAEQILQTHITSFLNGRAFLRT